MDPFVPHGRITRAPVVPGPLSGLSVAVKDLFDWAGVPTGAGNPDWLATHPVPTVDAPVLTTLLGAGASLAGKTITDELAYSIHGDNVHYGTPDNPSAPGRVPGGSSSGSASAVALGLADAALGTDTGGSVRVPAAYCGLWGLRTTHGLVDRTGLVALSPSFDTVGWFARDPETLVRITEVLVPADVPEKGSESADSVWTLEGADEATDDDTRAATLRVTRVLGTLGRTPAPRRLETTPFGGLEGLRRAYATVQGWEAWALHGPWINNHHPRLGPAIAARFDVASRITADQVAGARVVLQAFRAAFRDALGDRGVLVLPSTAGPAPLVGEEAATVDAVRTQTMRLTCPAGLAGLPQVTLPFRGADGLPRGVGLVGPAGSDRALCRLAQAVGVP